MSGMTYRCGAGRRCATLAALVALVCVGGEGVALGKDKDKPARSEACLTPTDKAHPSQSRRKKRDERCGLSSGQARADFNGDGVADLAVGVPREDVGSIVDAGAVNVIYGSANGLVATGNQLWQQDSTGIADSVEVDDRFGTALAGGDFNGDGFSDLAVGAPGEDVGSIVDAGAVHVLYGSPNGLTASGNQLFTQDSPVIADLAEAGDSFGQSLVWGNFGRDAAADLAVGVPNEDLGAGASGAGAVNVLYGLVGTVSGGLGAVGNQFWTQDSAGVLDAAESFDNWALHLTAGDFNGDGFADLVAGAVFEDVGAVGGAGAVSVIYGSSSGLTSAGNQVWHQDIAGVADAAEQSDVLGGGLAAGDFNGDGRADLAVGVTGEDLAVPSAGAVHVFYGSASGLVIAGNQFLHQDSPGIQDAAEPGSDNFGTALARGDFNQDGHADLAVGVPFESVGSSGDAGVVHVIYGSASGLGTAGDQLWDSGSAGTGNPVLSFHFGTALSGWNFGNGTPTDLAIGSYSGPGTLAAGTVSVLYGAPGPVRLGGGLRATGAQLWHQDVDGILDTAEPGDSFGETLY